MRSCTGNVRLMNAVFSKWAVRSNIASPLVSDRVFTFLHRLEWQVVDTNLPLRKSTLDSVKPLIDYALGPRGHTKQEYLSQAPDMSAQSGGHGRCPWLPLLPAPIPSMDSGKGSGQFGVPGVIMG
jgi:hypothetical protein